jgi:hypothetical protein
MLLNKANQWLGQVQGLRKQTFPLVEESAKSFAKGMDTGRPLIFTFNATDFH